MRCIKCGEKFRRPPLTGECPKCGGNVVLTVYEGSVRKYLEVSKKSGKGMEFPAIPDRELSFWIKIYVLYSKITGLNNLDFRTLCTGPRAKTG